MAQNPFSHIPGPQDFSQYSGISIQNAEIVQASLYDFQIYPTAGLLSIPFFQNPIGQGVTSAPGATVGTAKTYADTNMVLAGQLPQGQAFWIDNIQIYFLPGAVSTANTYTPAVPGVFATDDAAAIVAQVNDVETIRQAGWLELNVLNKNQIREAPLGVFPPVNALVLDAAIGDISATTPGALCAVSAKWGGDPYFMKVPQVLLSGVNFNVTAVFPGLVATPSTFNARIGVRLDGYLLRASQ